MNPGRASVLPVLLLLPDLRPDAWLVASLLITSALVVAGPAAADWVRNDILVANGQAVIAPGETILVRYHVEATGNDRQAGCNAADATPLTLRILPDGPGVLASPSELRFTACAQPQDVILHGLVAGNYRIGLDALDAGPGAYAVGGATFTLHVAAPEEPEPPADVEGPAWSLPAAVTYEAAGPGGAIVAYSASASDPSGAAGAECVPPSGSLFPLGTTTVRCVAVDALGNLAEASFDVTVSDTTAPGLDLPADLTREAEGPEGAFVDYAAGATDAVGLASFACAPPPGTFPLGATLVLCEASDAAGNAASGSFTVTVVDTTPPALLLPADVSREGDTLGGARIAYDASASDRVDGPLPAECDAPSGSLFPVGETTVTCSASDSRGNRATGSFRVTVTDATPPALGPLPHLSADATSGSGAPVAYAPTAWDVVDGAVPVTCDPPSGSAFPLGSTGVTCVATDASGNAASGSFQVSVLLRCDGPLSPFKEGKTLFRAGATIPVKCRPAGGSANVSDATIRLSMRQLNANAQTGDLAASSTSAADTGDVMRWDPTAGQYVYNLATKGLSRGLWELTLDFGGGHTKTVKVGLR